MSNAPKPSPLRGIDHVQLAMPPGGEPAARQFYTDALGLPEVPKPAELAGRGGCWFELGTTRVHLGVEEDFRPARKAHPALLVEGLAAFVEALGLELRWADDIVGMVHGYVDDPFGNRIELIEAATAIPSRPDAGAWSGRASQRSGQRDAPDERSERGH